MAAAVGSAIIFDKIEPYSWIAAALGIVSACTSISMYLFWREKDTDQDVSETKKEILDVASSHDWSSASDVTSSLVRSIALPPVFVGSRPSEVFSSKVLSSVGSVKRAISIASYKGELELVFRQSIHTTGSKRGAGSTWMIVGLDEAGAPALRVHTRWQKRTLFAISRESRLGGISSEPLWISALVASGFGDVSRGVTKEARRQKPFVWPDVLSELANPKERLSH